MHFYFPLFVQIYIDIYMLEYRDDCKVGILVTGGKVPDYFEEIELSPLCTNKSFPYIPSFARLLSGEENEVIKRFVDRQLQETQ